MTTLQQRLSPLWNDLLEELTDRLQGVQTEGIHPLTWTAKSLRISEDMLQRLTEYIKVYEFTDKPEETTFYKTIKPAFHSKVLCYRKIYSIELNCPVGDKKIKEEYFINEQLLLKEFYDENKFFYQYLRSESTYLDEKLFFRPDPSATYVMYFNNISELFFNQPNPICFDYIVAKVQANDLISSYLEGRIWELNNADAGKSSAIKPLIWTDVKTGLIELAYALYKKGSFNEGKTELKDIIRLLEKAFSVDLGNYPRTFQEILSRKTGYTSFMDKLRECLILYINAIEQKYDR